MILRRAADHRLMPWANGRGQTVEVWRQDGPEGLLLRLSVATVAEDGPFSLFPGVERSLTVISGPGFRLTGAVELDCQPLVPVAFPGDVAVSATGVAGPSEDFNVMTARSLPRPIVTVAKGDVPAAGRVFLLVLQAGIVSGVAVGPRDLVIADGEALRLSGAMGLAVHLR